MTYANERERAEAVSVFVRIITQTGRRNLSAARHYLQFDPLPKAVYEREDEISGAWNEALRSAEPMFPYPTWIVGMRHKKKSIIGTVTAIEDIGDGPYETRWRMCVQPNGGANPMTFISTSPDMRYWDASKSGGGIGWKLNFAYSPNDDPSSRAERYRGWHNA